MQQVKFVDRPGQEFLGTTQGVLPQSSSITCEIESPPERSRIAGKYSVSSNATVDSVVFREFELL